LTFLRLSILALLCILLTVPTVSAQEEVKGIVWQPPARFEKAKQDLIDMKNIGVEAIKTPLITDERLYAVADSLELSLYQDLPFSYLSSSELVQSVDEAQQLLESALRNASNHPSARHFGLTAYSNTGVESSCRFVTEVVNFARSRSSVNYRFYYSTFFIEQELCAADVDLVLVDVQNDQDYSEKMRRWAQSHPQTPLGLANIGTWVINSPSDEDKTKGYLSEHSEEYQARFLENALKELLVEPSGANPHVIFVYRWRDTRLPYPSSAHNLSQPYRNPYGMISSGNQTRLAYDVLKGFYLGNQYVFAFPAGQANSSSPEWITLLVWLNILILSIAYAYFPRFRLMARRYFTAHGFFREAIREGRELLIGPNVLIFLALTSAFGLCVTVALDAFRKTEAFSLVLRWIPESISFTAVALLSQPFLLFIALAGTYGLLLSFWTSALSVISTRSRWTLLPGQSFMLVLWSQWPLLLVMIGAGVIHSMDQPQLSRMALLLVAALILLIAAGMLFTLRDYWYISKANPAIVTVSLIINPITLFLAAVSYYCIQYADQLNFALHVVQTH